MLEEWDNAIERYRVNHESAIKTKRKSPYSSCNLSRVYMAKGLYEEALEVLEEYLNMDAENPVALLVLTLYYPSQEKYNLALTTAEKVDSLNPGFGGWNAYGAIFHLKGDLVQAEIEYQKCFESEDKSKHVYGREKLVALYLLQGKFNKAKEQTKKGLELGEKFWLADFHKLLAYTNLVSGDSVDALKELEKSWQIDIEENWPGMPGERWTLFLKGLANIALGSIDEAQNTADELKESIENVLYRKHWRYCYHLLGKIELKKDNFSEAIDNFNKALASVSSQAGIYSFEEAHALFMEPLALAYYESGDLEKALAEYEKITKLTTGRLYYDDIYAKSFYMLGKIYEEQGDTTRAIEHYQKFLDLWKDADPGICEVDDANKKLAGLKGN